MVKMFNEEVMVLCRKCGRQVESSKMKLDVDEKMVICFDCIKNKKIKPAAKQPQLTQEEHEHVLKIRPELPEEKISKALYTCRSCSYNFRYNKETKIPRNCPYCGKPVFY